MKELHPNIDENKLWQICFPYIHSYVAQEGSYIMVSPEQVLSTMEGDDVSTPVKRALFRLNMAMACLWPYVENLFSIDFFPHRLAAATDLLRAAEFGEGGDKLLVALPGELAEALDELEKQLGSDESERIYRAAEDIDHE